MVKTVENEHLPQFSRIDLKKIEPTLEKIFAENENAISTSLAQTTLNWDTFIQPFLDSHEQLDQFWSPISHLHAVAEDEAVRHCYNQCLPKLTQYFTQMGQNEKIYQAFNQISASSEFTHYSEAQQKVVTNTLRDFKLAGVALSPAKKAEYLKLQTRLSRLTTQFEENLLDATAAWTKNITDSAQLGGIPQHLLTVAAEEAKNRQQEGWTFTLEYPVYQGIMSYADSRELRQEFYTAYVTRASNQGPFAGQWDNKSIIDDILLIRQQIANLLGFSHYSTLSLATKMAKSAEEVIDFLDDLANRFRPFAEREFAELTDFANSTSGLSQLEAWDIAYYSEKLCQHLYAFSQEDLRAYFPEEKVLTGLFLLVEVLYGLSIEEVQGIDVWDENVRFFTIYDENRVMRGQFYLDLYSRSNKRGGAWMDECLSRHRFLNGTLQLPVAYIICNFTYNPALQSALLTHDEVLTLFHEFGHGLHHLLTQVEYGAISGINGVAWDAVELPSQFMENFVWEEAILDRLTAHYQTGEPLPDELFKKMTAAKNFQAGMAMMRQLEFSLFDMKLHHQYNPSQPIDVAKLLAEIRAEVAVVPTPEFNRFPEGFSHIFAGGYGAGYYSYLWAEVLACDAYAKFEEGGVLNAKVGREFLHHILEMGGLREPMALFIAFRQRKPTLDALLKHRGLGGG